MRSATRGVAAPLHERTDRDNFDGFHTHWMTGIAGLLRRTTPPYQVPLGSGPRMAVGGSRHRPNVGVANGAHPHPPSAGGAVREPDDEVTVATLEDEPTVQVERDGRMVAAIELISPRNTHRPDTRDYDTPRHLSCPHHDVRLLQVDVHRRPLAFSFPQRFATELGTELPAPPAPCAVAYRVGEPLDGVGRLLAVWADPLTAGRPLPTMSLPLTAHLAAPVELKGTYSRSAESCSLG